MAKLTKKQYSRKRLMAAALIFVAVALIVTGVAIWLLFNALNGTFGGNIAVGAVVDSPLEFSRIVIDGIEVDLRSPDHSVDSGFRFDSASGDLDGRLMWNGEDAEKMSVHVDVVIDHAMYLQQFEYELELPEGVIEAARKGYLVIDEYYDWEKAEPKRIEIPVDSGTYYKEQDSWRLQFDLYLYWGEAFGGVNPSIWYDDGGADVPYDDMVDVLNDFHDIIMGGSKFSTPTFTLTLIASPKV